MTEDRLAKIHREWREQCIKVGKYRPITNEELDREQARWKAECNRPPRKTTARKHPPKGHAD
jgi:hypothetical protein